MVISFAASRLVNVWFTEDANESRNRGHPLCGKSTAVYRKRMTNTVAYPPRNSKGTRDVHKDIPYAEVAHSRIELLFQE